MIKEHCFSKEWFEGFKKQKNHTRIGGIILERIQLFPYPVNFLVLLFN